MGTPEFAVASLKALLEEGLNVVGVITTPDKPAGRGRKPRPSAVKTFAEEKGLPVLQPERLQERTFLNRLKEFAPDLQVVVAFRMLPAIVWQLPELGTINLHASLLPQYRGAAPINRVLMNGESLTGVTTFFLKKDIDTGNIIDREKVPVREDETAGELHDELKEVGAALLVRSIRKVLRGRYRTVAQKSLVEGPLREAPKIRKEDRRIDWKEDVQKVHDQIRGLSPYPAAWTEVVTPDKTFSMKILRARKLDKQPGETPGSILDHSRNAFLIAASNGYIEPLELQPAGKGKISAQDFLNGYPVTVEWYCQ